MSDLLQRHLRDLPAFRALLRAVEARFFQDLPISDPVLDLGCGDGHFASSAFATSLAAGCDISWPALTEAKERRAHRTLALAEGGRMPFPDDYFGTVVSNSVLEHVPDLAPLLTEIARVLRPGGRFYFSVPGPNFLEFLSVGRALDRVGLRASADAYRRFFDRISGHHHCDGARVWKERLETAGLEVVDVWPYVSRRALTMVEWGHYLGLPALVCKRLTGRWVLWRSRANLRLTERLLRPFYEERLGQVPLEAVGSEGDGRSEGAYLFFAVVEPDVPRAAG
jgi:SAM-dependent methyltransferase